MKMPNGRKKQCLLIIRKQTYVLIVPEIIMKTIRTVNEADGKIKNISTDWKQCIF